MTIASSTGNTVISGTLNAGASTLASASVTGALSSGAATLASATLNGDLSTSGDIAMSKTASAITHTAAAGATSGLTISSDNGFVEVESVRITGGASKSDIGYRCDGDHRAIRYGRGRDWDADIERAGDARERYSDRGAFAGATTITGATGITGRRPSRARQS